MSRYSKEIGSLSCRSLTGSYRFYYADERHEDGTPMTSGLNGDAHADAYLELARDPAQRAWNYIFAKGKGYVDFPRLEVIA